MTTRKVDVRHLEEVESWIQETAATFGELNGAANVAGIAAGDGSTTVENMVGIH